MQTCLVRLCSPTQKRPMLMMLMTLPQLAPNCLRPFCRQGHCSLTATYIARLSSHIRSKEKKRKERGGEGKEGKSTPFGVNTIEVFQTAAASVLRKAKSADTCCICAVVS